MMPCLTTSAMPERNSRLHHRVERMAAYVAARSRDAGHISTALVPLGAMAQGKIRVSPTTCREM